VVANSRANGHWSREPWDELTHAIAKLRELLRHFDLADNLIARNACSIKGTDH
jgi:hypothetical protein